MNDAEAEIVQTVVNSMLSCGLEASSIGLICPFRAQVRCREILHASRSSSRLVVVPYSQSIAFFYRNSFDFLMTLTK